MIGRFIVASPPPTLNAKVAMLSGGGDVADLQQALDILPPDQMGQVGSF